MDDTRDQHWQSLLFVISVIVFGTGIYFYFKNRYTRQPSSMTQEALRSSEHELENTNPPPASPFLPSEDPHHPSHRDGEQMMTEHTPPHHPSRVSTNSPPTVQSKKNLEQHPSVCQSLSGFQSSSFRLQPTLWKKTQVLFRHTQNQLISALSQPQTGITVQVLSVLKKQILQIKLASPPWQAGPHLKRQALGIWERGYPSSTLHLGEGFFALLESDPQRAQFEMSRWVAQSIAPCEVESVEAKELWAPFLKCLGLSETCGNHLYSEAGWAASSSIAWILSPPQCQLPAFRTQHTNQCLSKLPFTKLTQSQEATP